MSLEPERKHGDAIFQPMIREQSRALPSAYTGLLLQSSRLFQDKGRNYEAPEQWSAAHPVYYLEQPIPKEDAVFAL